MDAVQGISSVTPISRDVIRSGAFYPAGSVVLCRKPAFGVEPFTRKWAASRLTGRSRGVSSLWIRFAEHADLVVTSGLTRRINYTGKNRSMLNVETWREKKSAPFAAGFGSARSMGDRLVQRKRLAEKLLFRTARI